MDRPRILIATTTWWPSAARLAVAFRDGGAVVAAICPRGHPLRVLAGSCSIHTYAAAFPLDALTRAIAAEMPDIVVPTDDRVVAHLHALHAAAAAAAADDAGGSRLRTLIERSLGAQEGFALSGTRDRLLRTVRSAGIPVPSGREINSPADLSAWFAEVPGRCVVKTEGTWGGSGIAVVDGFDAARTAFLRMSRPLAFRRALRILLFDRDAFPFVQFLRRERRIVSVQRFIKGRQANIMAACWNGRVLDTLGVVVIRAQNGTGASTVVRMTHCPAMEAAAAVVTRCLGASGFIGLDFIIEDGTDLCYLIEVNPRATQLGHLRRHGVHLASALIGVLVGTPAVRTNHDEPDQVVALFPQALRFDVDWLQHNPTLIDVPWSEPRLVRELLRRPWTKRSLLARIEGWLRNNNIQGRVLSRRRAAHTLAILSGYGHDAAHGSRSLLEKG